MNLSFTTFQKLTLVFVLFVISLIGFLLKLPSFLRNYDKELHSSFYFFAALTLNILFQKRQLIIFIFLFFFGAFIELSQQFSNRFFQRRIHGNFDPEDIKSNLLGLIAFFIFWLTFKSLMTKKNPSQN